MFTKLRFKIELFWYYLRKNTPYLILGIVVGITAFYFRQNLSSIYKKIVQKPIKIGIEGLYTTTNLPQEIASKISLGLTQTNENGKTSLSPLVKKLDISSDHLQYTFQLDTTQQWHNGKNLTSSDINYKITGLKFTPSGSDKIIVSTDKAYAPLETLLSQPIFKKNLVGLGEYKVSKIQYQDGHINYLRLTANSQPTLIYRFYQNQTDLLNAFKIGEVNQIRLSYLPPEFETTDWKVKIDQDIGSQERYLAIFLNTIKLSNKQLRQALSYATPKNSDKNERALSPISPTSWAYNPSVKEYNFTPSKAREFFEKNRIESIALTVSDRNLLPLAEDIKKSWEEILKLKVEIKATNQVDFNNYDAILAYGSIPVDPDQYVFWHSTQATNITHINNARIDKLLEEGRLTFDQLERKKVYQEFQRALLEESPAIFLQYPTFYTISKN